MKTTAWLTWMMCVLTTIAPLAQAQNPTPNDAGPKPVVQVIKPSRGTISLPVQVPATIEAIEHAQLYARQAGYVSEVLRGDSGKFGLGIRQ